MKYSTVFLSFCLLFLSPAGKAQVSTGRNYVHQSTVTKPGILNQAQVDALSSTRDRLQQVSYFDGLGRPIQSITIKGSQGTKDIVAPVEYDGYGREVKQFLPYVDDSAAYGSLRPIAVTHQAYYYNAANTGSDAPKDIHPYSQQLLEFSPLNRARQTGAPGATWQPGEGHTVNTRHLLNTLIDSVRIWKVTVHATMGNFSTYASPGAYPAGELYKLITEDEHGKQVIEFKDKEGKVILKKVQLTAARDSVLGKGHTGWLCTYYLYDEQNNLRCVLQPRGVELIASNWVLTNGTILAEQCFRYEYDERGRMIIKKVPGAGQVNMVYDSRDRLVMTQDANMRVAPVRWLVTKYDALNRPVETGLWENASSFASHRTAAQGAAMPAGYPTTSSNYTELTKTFYDNLSWLAGEGNPLPGTMSASLDGYYQAASDVVWPYPQAMVASSQTTGMVTGTKTRVLGTGTFLYTVNFYDAKGRLIQTRATNASGSNADLNGTQYAWNGQPLRSIQRIYKQGSNNQHMIVRSHYFYDSLWRLLRVEKKVLHSQVDGGANPANWTKIAEHQYDGLGQLKRKKLAPGYNSNAGLDSLTYDYNIRGWLLGMNRRYARDEHTNNYFGFDLGYDKTSNQLIGGQSYTAAQYNGNIAGMVWKSKGDGEKRKYDFSYDAANRLMRADFTQYNGSVFNQSAGINYNMLMGNGTDPNQAYDANGNIKKIQQWGLKAIGGSARIDNLGYSYSTNSNRLTRVIDGETADHKLGDFNNGASGTSTDYTYDGNGNMLSDLNKAISSISYNHLNLPQTITVTGKGTVTYTYDAAGNKLKKETVDNTVSPSKTTTTLYIGGTVYRNDTLELIGHEEGRVRFKPENNTLHYDYMLKDHLGNVRMVLTEEEKQDQYPAATLETTEIATEETYYGNLSNTQYNKPGWFSDPLYGTNAKVARLKNESGVQKVGPNMVLKVMAGDSYNIRVASGWSSGSSATNSATNVLADLLNLLSTGVAGASGGKVSAGDLQAGGSGLNTALTTFLGTQTTSGSKPKAYINWILLDEQFKVITGSSGFEQVGGSGTTTIHTKTNVNIAKSGYLYIYTSNEATNIEVFFDNLQVTHTRGPILEESHYYPFGLTMAGISSKALSFGEPKNKEKTFQGQQFDDDLGLNWVQFKWRNHDPQIGRFIQVDPLASDYVYNSTYAFSENKVTAHIELEGLESFSIQNVWKSAGITSNTEHEINAKLKTIKEDVQPVGEALLQAGKYGVLIAGIATLNPLAISLGIPSLGLTITQDIALATNPDNQEAKDMPTSVLGSIGHVIDKTKESITGEKSNGTFQAVGDFSEAALGAKSLLKNPFQAKTVVEKVDKINTAVNVIDKGINLFNNLFDNSSVKEVDKKNEKQISLAPPKTLL